MSHAANNNSTFIQACKDGRKRAAIKPGVSEKERLVMCFVLIAAFAVPVCAYATGTLRMLICVERLTITFSNVSGSSHESQSFLVSFGVCIASPPPQND